MWKLVTNVSEGLQIDVGSKFLGEVGKTMSTWLHDKITKLAS